MGGNTQRVVGEPRDTPSKKVFLSGTPEQIEAACAKLQNADKAAERNRILSIVGIVVSVIAFIVVAVATDGNPVGLIACAAAAVACGVATYLFSSGDLEDRKIEMPRTLLATFKDELRPGRPVEVSIDFRGYWRRPDTPWLQIKMTLQNGVVAQLTATDRCKRKSRAKRKYTKIKDKIVETLTVRLIAPKGRNLDPGRQPPRGQVRIGSLRLSDVKIAPRAATFVYATPQVIRLRNRGGWQNAQFIAAMPSGRELVRTLIASYGMLGLTGTAAQAPQPSAPA